MILSAHLQNLEMGRSQKANSILIRPNSSSQPHRCILHSTACVSNGIVIVVVGPESVAGENSIKVLANPTIDGRLSGRHAP